ncbi:type IV pilus major pilin [Vibrio cholerae]
MKAFEFFSAKRQQFAQRAQAAFAQYKEAKKQRGMTLLEVIIVLGIIGTIAAGVVVLAQRAFDSRTVSEVVQNTNTIRVAIKDAYSTSGKYPEAETADILSLDNNSILSSTTSKKSGATAALVQIGKVSVDEMRNKISGDFYAIEPGHTSQTNAKGYVIEVNGLTAEQCRSIVGQVGNNWDYVEVPAQGAAAGSYTITKAGVSMFAEPSATILRSLGTGGSAAITPDKIVTVCNSTGASNSIILGSR